MKQIKYYVIGLCLLIPLFAVAQPARESKIPVSSMVTDESGSPLAGVRIFANEGKTRIFTDLEGRFVLDAFASEMIVIEADTYEKETLIAGAINTMDKIILTQLPFHLRTEDLVEVPFGTMKKRHIVGSVFSLNPEEISHFDSNVSIREALRGRVPGMFDVSSIRGIGEPLVVVDGIPRSSRSRGSNFEFIDLMTLDEVEQIVVIKDASMSMLYGANADQGVIIVTTKRGIPYQNQLNVRMESGLNTPVAYPKFLNAADYMTMHNLASANDGITPRYSLGAIDSTRMGIDRLRYPDEDFFNSTYLNDFSNASRLAVDASGGDDRTRYFTNISWLRSDDLYALSQQGKSFTNNQFSFRGNVDYWITNWLKANLDGFLQFGANRQPVRSFWTDASTHLPNAYPLLIPVSRVNNNVLLEAATIFDNEYILGGTNQYTNNIYGNFAMGGYRTLMNRASQINLGLDFDLESITKGLTAKSYFGYDILNGFNLSYQHEYAVYERGIVPAVSGSGDSLTFTKIGIDRRVQNQNLSNSRAERRFGLFSTLNYDRLFNDRHHVTAAAVGYWDKSNVVARFYSIKNNHFGLRANYMLDNRYVAQFSATLTGSSYLPEDNRYQWAPSAGLGWIVSEEDFLSGSSFVDYLKVKASYGRVLTDNGFPDYRTYNTSFTGGGNFQYNRNLSSNSIRVFNNVANRDLSLIQRNDLNVGLEAMLANNSLWIDANYFISSSAGNIVRRGNYYPQYFAILAYENYNEFRDQGFDLGLNMNKAVGSVQLNLGASMVYTIPNTVQIDEPGYPDAPYRQMQGHPYDAIFGYVADGLFANQQDINNSPSQIALGRTIPGDIKYRDLNNDGVIDENDQQIIGYARPRFDYGVHLSLTYKDFSLFVLGSGQHGADRIFRQSYYWQTGQDAKYSEEVLNSWTPETAATATYPALHLLSADNNHVNSTYWIEKANFYTLHTLQLTYNITRQNARVLQKAQVYARGHNLATFSPIKDKLELNIGSAPQMRYYALGLIVTF